MNALAKVETMTATATASPVDLAPLARKALLVSISISAWGGRKTDRAATDKVTTEAGANADAARVTKALVSKTALADIAAIAMRARGEHYRRTLPWNDNGTRILSAMGRLTYGPAIEALRTEFAAAVDRFISGYDAYRAQAKIDLGALFDEADYPDAGAIRAKFSFPKPRILPFPAAADFRVEMGQAELERVRAEIEADVQGAVRVAMSDAYQRVADVVGAMADKLAAFKPATRKGERSEGIFRDSLVENIRDLAGVLPSLNITGDSRLADITARLADLTANDADVLRDHADVRADVARKAAAIAADVAAFMA